MLLCRVSLHNMLPEELCAATWDESAVEMGLVGWKTGLSLCPQCCLVFPQVFLISLGQANFCNNVQ